ncbi:MAG: hypothetical protein ACMXX9_02065 [Candidatus Woesearchaeota archaeon]
MVDYRKAVVSITIAILFTFFVFASIQAVKQSPNYSDYCDFITYPDRLELSQEEFEEQRQLFEQTQRECQQEYDDANKEYALFVFIIAGILSLIAIFIALKLPEKDDVMAMIATGLLLGGLITLFVGTIRGWDGLHIYIRPLVLLAELVLVIYLAYKTMSKKKKK